MARPIRAADCHPERKHVGRGMCYKCYWKWHRSTHKEAYNKANKTYRVKYPKGGKTTLFERLWVMQDGKCALGGCPLTRTQYGKFKACLDHDHASNAYRGLLCDTHNKALGFYEKRILPILTTVEEYRQRVVTIDSDST